MDHSCQDATHLLEEPKTAGDRSTEVTEVPKPLPELPLAKAKVERLQVKNSEQYDGDGQDQVGDEDEEEEGVDEEDMEEEEDDQDEPLQPLIVINGKSMAFIVAFCLLLAFSCIMVGFSGSMLLTDQQQQQHSSLPPVIPQGIKALFPGMNLEEMINKAVANITEEKKYPGAPPFQYQHEWRIGSFQILAYHLWRRDTNFFNDCITFRFVNNPLSRMTSAIMLEKINEGEKHQLWGKTKCKREINDEGVVYCEEFSLCV